MSFPFKRYCVAVILLLDIHLVAAPSQQAIDNTRNDGKVDRVKIQRIIQSVQHRYAPDLSLAVFNVSYSEIEKGIVVRGEVDNPLAKKAAIQALQKGLKYRILDSIRVLPDSTLSDKTTGIVLTSVANIFRKPGEQEELVTQALMGTVVKLLKKENGYLFIQTPDRYLGWIDTHHVFICSEDAINKWNAASKVIVIKFFGAVYSQSDTSSEKVCELIDGCILKTSGKKKSWVSVERADGKKGFVPDSIVQNIDEWKKNRVPTGDNLEKTARSFLGIHYLWGGMSVKGMDCSGFIKTVYHLNGIELNRDARQQAQQGSPVDPGEKFQNLKKGDLLFFGRKATAKQREHITHVALYLENGLYIHSSKRVRFGNVYPSSEYYEEPLLKRLVRVRRILKN